jgi:hypothetical protein
VKEEQNEMFKYGEKDMADHKFEMRLLEVEERGSWFDLYYEIKAVAGTLPDDLTDPGIKVICNRKGILAEAVLLDVGCDSEYQFTVIEKEQIRQTALQDMESWRRKMNLEV